MREILTVLFFVGFFLLGMWTGSGMGIMYCADHPEGYNNGYFRSDIRAYCRLETIK